MNNRHIFIGLILAFSSFCHAQEAATDTVTSVRAEEILPESMIISEEEMMKDFANAANLTKVTGSARTSSSVKPTISLNPYERE